MRMKDWLIWFGIIIFGNLYLRIYEQPLFIWFAWQFIIWAYFLLMTYIDILERHAKLIQKFEEWRISRVEKAKACPYYNECHKQCFMFRREFMVTEEEEMSCLTEAFEFCPLYKLWLRLQYEKELIGTKKPEREKIEPKKDYQNPYWYWHLYFPFNKPM